MAYDRRGYAGAAASTTVNGAINAVATSLTLNNPITGWPDGSSGRKFVAVIDRGLATEEKILCTSRSGVSVTISSRGYDGTSAQSHANSAPIEHVISATDMDEANYAVEQTVGKVTTAEDLLVASGANAFKRLAKGSNTQVLTMSAGTVGWSAPGAATGPTGYLGSASVTTDQAGIGTSTTDLTGLSTAVTVGTSRRIKITAQVTFLKATTSEVTLLLREGSTVLDAVRNTIEDVDNVTFNLVYTAAGITGSHTYKLSAICDAGTATLEVNSATPRRAWIIVEDIGT